MRERERSKPERRGENGSRKDRKSEEVGGNKGGKEGGRRGFLCGRDKVGERGRNRGREREEEVSGTSRSWRQLHPVAWQSMHRSMLAPQSLSRSRDYRTHNALGHPAANRSPTWELQVGREEGGKH